MTEEQWYPWEETEQHAGKRGRPWLWIGLPMFIGVLLIAGIVVAVLNMGFGTTQIWADVSLVIVLLPFCLLGFIPLIVLIGLSYGVGRLVGWLPDPLKQIDSFLAQAARESRRGSELIARPMLVAQGFLAMVGTFLRGLIEMVR
jgi:hypothetical protein